MIFFIFFTKPSAFGHSMNIFSIYTVLVNNKRTTENRIRCCYSKAITPFYITFFLFHNCRGESPGPPFFYK